MIFFFPACTPLQNAPFHVHAVSDVLSTLLVAGLPPHWLLLLRCLHPVHQSHPGRWGMVVTERLSPPLHMWSFTRCVRCRFQYPLFLHRGGGLHSPLAYLVLLGRGAPSVACTVSASIFSGAAMSVALSTIVVVFEMGPLAATSAHDAMVAGLLFARSRRLCGYAVCR